MFESIMVCMRVSLVDISHSDEMSSSTRVHVIRCVWAPAAMPYLIR
jgi:hypothetical protein